MNLRQRIRFIRWLRKRRFAYPIRTLRAVRKSKLDPALAAVLLLKESGGGRNVFGCDHGRGRAFCHEKVTREKVMRLLEADMANGVGPTQLTWPPYVVQANKAGGAWRPQVNMVVGFTIFKELLREEGSVWGAAKRYNGASEYADDFVERLRGVRRSLKGARVI